MYEDTFSLIAEISIGLAGFSGVAAAFGGRDRSFRRTERIRLTGVFVMAGSTLAGCLAIYATAAAGFIAATQYQAAGSVCFVVSAWMLAVPIRQAGGETGNPESTASVGVLALTAGLTTLCLVLYGMCVFQGGLSGPLVSGMSIQLLTGLWMFTRLLTRSN